eukprot:12912030-Ditylum_brightwellii.AAC.1
MNHKTKAAYNKAQEESNQILSQQQTPAVTITPQPSTPQNTTATSIPTQNINNSNTINAIITLYSNILTCRNPPQAPTPNIEMGQIIKYDSTHNHMNHEIYTMVLDSRVTNHMSGSLYRALAQ